jgi:DNA-binding transcriptional MerR regulator
MGPSTHNIGTIPLTAFDLDAVARVTGLSISQLQRWDRTGFFHPSLADPNRRRPGSRIYSRDDVVALRVIAKLREAGVSLAQLKPLLPLLARDESGQWPACSFHVGGNRVFLERDDAVSAASQAGQDGVTTFDMASVVAEVGEAIDRLRVRPPEQIGQVPRKRGIMGGVPIIAGTRIPTETIAWSTTMAIHSIGSSGSFRD